MPVRLRIGGYNGFFGLTAFGVAMGIMEAVIVVYLRALFYPEGFRFPLKNSLDFVLLRMASGNSTMVMLAAIAFLSGRTKLDRFVYFIFSFAVWDLFYYAGLKWLLGWPDSIMTWDVLFLIPVPWLAPVLAPVLCSMGMIGLAVLISQLQTKKGLRSLRLPEWTFLLAGSFMIFLTFIWDFSKLIIKNGFLGNLPNLAKNPEFKTVVSRFAPDQFLWPLFFIGVLFILAGIGNIIRRSLKEL